MPRELLIDYVLKMCLALEIVTTKAHEENKLNHGDKGIAGSNLSKLVAYFSQHTS